MRLVGPVFYYDLVRTARRGRLFFIRVLYVLFLLLALFILYLLLQPRLTQLTQRTGGFSPKLLAQLGEGFFAAFMLLQFVAVLILAPGMVAGAITEEKQRQTLDFLFTTNLLNREIILGKFASRLGNCLMLLLAGLPVLSLVQLFGGVDPIVLSACYAVTLATLVFVACLTLYLSVISRRVREALLKTYLVMVAYLAGWGALELFWGMSLLDHAASDPIPATMREIIDVYNVANPVLLAYRFERFVSTRTPLALSLLTQQGLAYICSQLALAALLLIRATQVVRKVYIRQTYDPKPKKRLKGWMAIPVGEAARSLFIPKAKVTTNAKPLPRRLTRRPPVGQKPMTWKECYAERGLRFGVFAETLYVILLFLMLSPLVVLWGVLAVNQWYGMGGFELETAYNRGFRLVAVGLMIFTWFGAGLRAAASIGSERDRQTWDGLMGSTLTIREIVSGKAVGCHWSVRRLLYLLAGFAMAGTFVGAIDWLAAVLLLIAAVLFTCFATNLGLYAAARTTRTQRAIFTFLFWFIFVNALPFAIQIFLDGFNSASGGAIFQGWRLPQWLVSLVFFSPIQAVFYLPSQPEQTFLGFDYSFKRKASWDLVLLRGGMLSLSLVSYGTVSMLLWYWAQRRLRRTTGRGEDTLPTKKEQRLAAEWAKGQVSQPITPAC